MQGAYQREQPPGGVEIHLDLALQPLLQKLAAFIVKPAPGHVDGFNLARCRRADGLIIAFADHEIIFHNPPEWRQRQPDHVEARFGVVANVENQAAFQNGQRQMIRPAILAQHGETVGLQQIINRHPPLMLGIW